MLEPMFVLKEMKGNGDKGSSALRVRPHPANAAADEKESN